MKSAREQVVEIIDRFYNTTLDLKTIQNSYFKQYSTNTLERNRIVVLSKEVLRWKGRIDLFLKCYLDHSINRLQSKLLAILELATYELIFDDKVPEYAVINSAVDLAKRKLNKKTSGLVNAVLRKIGSVDTNTQLKHIKDFEWYSFPNWLFEKWIKQFGKTRTHQLCDYFNAPVPLTIRRNHTKIDHKNFVEKIESDEIQLSRIDNSDYFYNIKSGGTRLLNNPLFQDGYFSFQDRGAGAIVEVLDPQPNDVILDVCCAPGTKTNYIAELIQNTGKIYASDINKERIGIAQKDEVRLKNTNIIWEQKDAIKDTFPMADRILIDIPCTGTGVIGRRPDIKWRRKPIHLKRIVDLQKAILNHVYKFVKQGGALVYATCSLEEEENWQVVEAFLNLHNDFQVASIENHELANLIDEKGALKTFPPENKMDGMFAVKMIREK
ncbi:MAG: 16S rRNA (cytosine(967)-C(5))-methyltransferase RsmB [Candidatus Marinimicrobia bacterium]|jgi:16S rRNA (cytosine967-C5)-methyltransferase|nr:16S rRNA (cytosine(967)-C(5))-methyltransferase RsmB [Candidatus Neomarinimicrobiota bacterium]